MLNTNILDPVIAVNNNDRFANKQAFQPRAELDHQQKSAGWNRLWNYLISFAILNITVVKTVNSSKVSTILVKVLQLIHISIKASSFFR